MLTLWSTPTFYPSLSETSTKGSGPLDYDHLEFICFFPIAFSFLNNNTVILRMRVAIQCLSISFFNTTGYIIRLSGFLTKVPSCILRKTDGLKLNVIPKSNQQTPKRRNELICKSTFKTVSTYISIS